MPVLCRFCFAAGWLIGTLLVGIFSTSASAERGGLAFGVEIVHIASGSPADKAGLQCGDRVLHFNQQECSNSAAVLRSLQAADLAREIPIRYHRDGVVRDAKLQLEERYFQLGHPLGKSTLARLDTPQPQVMRLGTRSSLVIKGPRLLGLTLPQAQKVKLDGTKVTESPMRGFRSEGALYSLEPPGLVTLGPGASLQTSQPLRLIWDADHGKQYLQVGTGERAPFPNRWQGWGMALEPTAWRNLEGRLPAWELRRYWGFAASGLDMGVPVSTSEQLAVPKGARVTATQPEGAAARAGLVVGDLIVSVNGKPVEEAPDLFRWMVQSLPGQEYRLGRLRGRQLAEVKLEAIAEEIPVPQQPKPLAKPLVRQEKEKSKIEVDWEPGTSQFRVTPLAHDEFRCEAAEIATKELAAQGNQPHQFVYTLMGPAQVQLSGGTVLHSERGFIVTWVKDGPHVFIAWIEKKKPGLNPSVLIQYNRFQAVTRAGSVAPCY